ncbi:MAG: UMP kinase [Desulfurococcus sp.]|jgi:uridylate kinase|uniref:UMP kinase n=1 Tax=Desulfurococcus sp. TaxID=51678 RepID=UPI0031663EA5
MSDVLVLKITGKAFDEGSTLISRYVKLLKSMVSEYRLVVITGGGNIARKYISDARSLGVSSNYWLDLIGIWVSRLNSLLIASSLQPYAYPKPAVSLEEVLEALSSHRVVAMGGLIPGQSTASTAIEVVEAVGAEKLYYFSAVGYVYDRDPAKYPDAKPLREINASLLKKILEQKQLPGEYALIDEKALDLAIRSKILVQLISYREPEKLLDALRGENPGSLIHPA